MNFVKKKIRTWKDNLDKKGFDINCLKSYTFINIGAGLTKIDIATNIDISKRADISVNLNEDKLPFDDDCVDLIYSDHTLEHINNYLHLINEIHRVLKPGGCLLVGVPYVTLTKYNLVNPYHVHNFNEYSFDFFDQSKIAGSAAEENGVDLRCLKVNYRYLGIFRFLFGARNLARKYLFNTVRDIRYLVVKGEQKSELTGQIENSFPQVYEMISKLRRRYIN